MEILLKLHIGDTCYSIWASVMYNTLCCGHYHLHSSILFIVATTITTQVCTYSWPFQVCAQVCVFGQLQMCTWFTEIAFQKMCVRKCVCMCAFVCLSAL